MAKKASKNKSSSGKTGRKLIAQNKRARRDYFIDRTYEAGLVLEGWEVKSLRAGRGQLSESYVQIHHGEAWLQGSHISPLLSASTHISPEAARNRKLLLNRGELDNLIGAVERKGFTLVPLAMYWVKGMAKLEIGLARGKKQHDKRTDEKDRDWQRQKERLMKH